MVHFLIQICSTIDSSILDDRKISVWICRYGHLLIQIFLSRSIIIGGRSYVNGVMNNLISLLQFQVRRTVLRLNVSRRIKNKNLRRRIFLGGRWIQGIGNNTIGYRVSIVGDEKEKPDIMKSQYRDLLNLIYLINKVISLAKKAIIRTFFSNEKMKNIRTEINISLESKNYTS